MLPLITEVHLIDCNMNPVHTIRMFQIVLAIIVNKEGFLSTNVLHSLKTSLHIKYSESVGWEVSSR